MPARNAASDPVSLLKDLIRRPSVTPTEAGVLDIVEQALRPLGFAVTRLRFEGDGSYPVDNLFATRAAGGPDGGRHLLFAGHTDVVPPGEGWTHDPFGAVEENGLLYGRGAADMKSGIAAFVGALMIGLPAEGRVSLVITNDEEQDAINGTDKLLKWAAEQGHRFDFAIVGEPSATATVGDSIKVGRRGSFSFEVTVTGVQGHVAYPDRARNPLPVLAAIVTALEAATLDAGTSDFPPSNLECVTIDTGNTASNVIPASGTARFNVRFNDTWSPATLERWVRERIADIDANGCEIGVATTGRPANAFLCPPGEGVDILARTITAFAGKQPVRSTAGGTSDARFVAQYCPVVECGLPGPSMHKADEHVALADVEALTRLYAAFIGAYLK